MAWTIQLFPDIGIAEVQYSGLVTYRERCEAKASLDERLEGSGIRFIIINYTGAQARDEDVGELRKFLDDMARTRFLRGVAVAYVDAPMEHETASRAMARLVGYTFESFRDRPAALAWLRERIEETKRAG